MKRIILSLCISALLFSCSSDNDAPTPITQVDNYYALNEGNSWVYKNYKRNNQTQNYDDTGVVDSVLIIAIEEINQKKYYKFRTRTTGNENNITYCNPNGEKFELLRDSIGYLVTDSGSIKYVNNDYTERTISINSWGVIYAKLVSNLVNISTESGAFNCSDMEVYARDSNHLSTPGLDHYYYADGVGLVFDTSSFVSDDKHMIERRLDSHVIQ